MLLQKKNAKAKLLHSVSQRFLIKIIAYTKKQKNVK